MNKSAKREVVENKIATIEGNSFQDLCDRLLLKLYPNDYTPVRAGGPKGDLKNDGYCPKARIFFAAHATRGETICGTKKKIKTDFEGCLKNQRRVKKWVYLTNNTLVGEVEACIDELRSEHSNMDIETWDHKKMAEKILAFDDTSITEIIGMDIISSIDIVTEIEDGVKLIQEGEVKSALLLLGRLWAKHSDKMSGREKYRTRANIGHAYDQIGEYQKAAESWLEAKQYDPNYEAAREREALAYLYLGNRGKAYELTNDVIRDYPQVKLGRAVWIRSMPEGVSFDEIESQIEEHIRKDPDVAMALADRAANAGNYEVAEKYMGLAINEAQDHPKIKFRLGILMMQKAKTDEQLVYGRSASQEENQCLKRAKGIFEENLCEWQERNQHNEIINVHIKLAHICRAMGDREGESFHVNIAYELDTSCPDTIILKAEKKANEGNIDEAINLVRKLSGGNDVRLFVEYILANMLWKRNQKEDRKEALEILRSHIGDLKEETIDFCYEYVELLTRIAGDIIGYDEAVRILHEEIGQLIGDESLPVIESMILERKGDNEDAKQLAKEVYNNINENTRWEDKRRIAILLQTLGLNHEALEIWKDIVKPEYIGQDIFNLLESARICDDVDCIFQFCEDLRKNHIWDDRTINLELEYREKYNDGDLAIKIMQEYLEHYDDEHNASMMRLRLSCLGMRMHKLEIVENDRDKLPDVTKVLPYNGRLVAQVLSYSTNPLEAVDYAYELWRLHPDDEDANLGFIHVNMPIGPKIELPEYDTVQPGTAVLYEDEETKEKIWHIIEDSLLGNIENARDEYSKEHCVSIKIVGKKKGDFFYLVKDDLQERKARILEISSKYLYRVQKCLEEFLKKFPGSKELCSFPGFKPDGTVNLEPMQKLAQRDEKSIEQIMEMYDSQLIPIYWLAKHKGVSEFVVMNYYGSRSKLKIKTCFGMADEWNYSVAVANNSKKLVLDITALVTLLFMDNDFWTKIDRELIISEGTYNRLRNIEAAQDDYVNEGSLASCNKGQLSFVSKDLQQAQAEQDRVKRFIVQVSKHCCVESGVILTQIPADKRKIYMDTIGQSNAETLVLASQGNNVLWTDDLALACLAITEFNCKRTWSQVIINLFGREETSDLNLKLFMYGYNFTKIGINDLKTAIEQSKWQVNKKPLSEVISIFSDNNILTESIRVLLTQFIKYIWQNTTEFTAQQITLEVLNELSRRQVGLFIIKVLPIDMIFGFDCVNANKVKNIIGHWLRVNASNTFLY
jgi:tetratricopeptide (TPR) repeat protein